MLSKNFIRRKKRLWHNHFLPSLIAAVLVGILSYLYDATLEDIILFASIGGSAVILSNSKSHHLTTLYTTIVSYLITIIISLLLYELNIVLPIRLSANIAILMFFVAITMFMFDAFHPPAITVSISFFMLHGSPADLIYLFVTIMVFFVMVRLITYMFSQHLTLSEFLTEFRRAF